jgi:hypothetical protein
MAHSLKRLNNNNFLFSKLQTGCVDHFKSICLNAQGHQCTCVNWGEIELNCEHV